MTDKPKTIGVKVDPELYEQLKQLKENRRLKSLSEALLMAARAGLAGPLWPSLQEKAPAPTGTGAPPMPEPGSTNLLG